MLLAQKFLLLYIDNESGRFVGTETGHGAAAALVADLVNAGIAWIAGDQVIIEADTRTEHWLLAEAARIASASCKGKLTSVIRTLSKNWPALRRRLVDEFVAAGVLRKEKRRLFFLFEKSAWPTENPSAEEATRSRLRRVLLANAPATEEDLALLAGVRSCRLLDQFIAKQDMATAKERLVALTSGSPFYRALEKIKEEDAALIIMMTSASTFPLFLGG